MEIGNGQIAIYQTDDGQTQTEVRVEQDTLWLTLLQMADCSTVTSRLFQNT